MARGLPDVAALVAFAALTLAAAIVLQDSGPNQAAHFALVRALASGTAEIDPGETIDSSYVDGRYYAAKAPGLAMFTLPWYGVLRAATPGRITRVRGRLSEPCLGAEPLRCRAADAGRARPHVPRGRADRAGVRAAHVGAARGGTLLLPFATLYFDHVLSAALGFAAFAVLFLERETRRGGWLLAAGGLLAGLALVVEFPLAVVAVVLGIYAALGAGPPIGSRHTPAGSSSASCRSPLNTWAFGTPWTLDYPNALKAPAGSGTPRSARTPKGSTASASRSPCRRLAPRVGKGPPDRDAAGAGGGGRTTPPVLVRPACGRPSSAACPAPLPRVQRRVLPPVRRQTRARGSCSPRCRSSPFRSASRYASGRSSWRESALRPSASWLSQRSPGR